jgi:hypothetical protein
VATVEHLMGSPTLSPNLSYLTRPSVSPTVERVALVEDMKALDRVGGNTIVLLTRSASALAGTYRFDVALRLARSFGVAGLVLAGPELADVTPTAAALADRAGIAILGTRADTDLAALAIAIGRELAGGADAALLRAHTAWRAVQAHPADAPAAALVGHAAAALGVPIALTDAEPEGGRPAVPVNLPDRPPMWLSAEHEDGDLGLALDLALAVTAAGAEEALLRAQRAADLPAQSRADVLSELLAVDQDGRPAVGYRASAVGLPIDGWHVAARLEFEPLVDGHMPDGVAAHSARGEVTRAALAALRNGVPDWYAARSGVAVVLVRMYAEDPGAGASGTVAHELDAILPQVRARLATTLIHCGVGSAHPGVEGLVSSAAEAKAAATAARTSQRTGAAVPFDSVGLRRTLVEWYASDTAQDAVATVLAPLVALGGARAERLIQTLHVYLDEQGSLTRAAEVLNLHRNAVSYRINQVFDLLEVDPESPDDRLLLQLACRARELAA